MVNMSVFDSIRFKYNTDSTIVIKYGSSDSTLTRSMHVYAEILKDTALKDLHIGTISSFQGDSIVYNPEESTYIKKSSNEYEVISNPQAINIDQECVILRLWWPVEKCGTYIKKLNRYCVAVYSYIDMIMDDKDMSGTKVIFKSSPVNMLDVLAGVPMMKFGILYQEYTDVYIPVEILENPTMDDIFITLSPMDPNSDTFIYTNCQEGSSFITNPYREGLRLIQTIDTSTQSITYHIGEEMEKFSTLYDMLKDTYGVRECTGFLRVMIIDEYGNEVINDRLKLLSPDDIIPYSVPTVEIFQDIPKEYTDGGFAVISALDIYFDDISERDIENDDWISTSINFISNPLPITQNIYNYISYPSDGESINNLHDVLPLSESIKNKIDEMNKTIITIPNIIEQHTVMVSQTNTGSGIIKPVFIHAYPLDSVVFHRDIKENIIINLDTYLGSTSMFYLKICGVFVPEYSRQYDGVVFNVDGSYITTNEGTYYICDEDKNLITTGKYTVE